MANKKKMSDLEVLEKAFPTISRYGFESFTLEQVSKATGLSAATLIKRFKTKKKLAVLARNQNWEINFQQMLEVTNNTNVSGIAGIFYFVNLISKSVESDNLAEHLRQLGNDALNTALKKTVGAYFQTTRDIFKYFIDQAIKNKELKGVENSKDLATLLEAIVQGSIFQFIFMERRSIYAHLKKNMEDFLKPYLA